MATNRTEMSDSWNESVKGNGVKGNRNRRGCDECEDESNQREDSHLSFSFESHAAKHS